MSIKAGFNHFNFNVLDLEKSIKFYDEALDLKEESRVEAEDKSFTLVYLANKLSDFRLELTFIKDRKKPYDLGELEYHLCMKANSDFDKLLALHKEMDCVVFENEDLGVYFIQDPDGYWIEIVPEDF